MIETGRPVDAAEARDWGLGNRVVDEGDALEVAVDLAETIAGFPQQALRTDRAAVYVGIGESLETGLRVEAWHGSRSLETARDGAERFTAGAGRSGEGLSEEDIEDS